MYARNAVDGDVTQSESHCSNPYDAKSHFEAWWQVNLGDVYVINSVIIVNYHQTGGLYIQGHYSSEHA